MGEEVNHFLVENMDLQTIVDSCREEFGCDVVLARYDSVESFVVISQLISQTPGKGNGTKCMKYLLKEFGDGGVKMVSLVACPTGGMKAAARHEGVIRLVKWYHRFGFEFVRYSKCGDYIANAEMEMAL